MARKKQESVVMLVNKDLISEAERSLYESVLWGFKVPAIRREVCLSGSTSRAKNVNGVNPQHGTK